MMSILKWLLILTSPDQVTEIKEGEVKEALVALFTNKVPTMNITDAEALSNKVVQDMYAAETLVTSEEWVKIVPGHMQGVIYQLTGSGCYAPTLHNPHCSRKMLLPSLSTNAEEGQSTESDYSNVRELGCVLQSEERGHRRQGQKGNGETKRPARNCTH